MHERSVIGHRHGDAARALRHFGRRCNIARRQRRLCQRSEAEWQFVPEAHPLQIGHRLPQSRQA
jgi:hypothetical protein